MKREARNWEPGKLAATGALLQHNAERLSLFGAESPGPRLISKRNLANQKLRVRGSQAPVSASAARPDISGFQFPRNEID